MSNILSIKSARERNVLDLDGVQHEVKQPRLASFLEFAGQLDVIQDPKVDIKQRFDASVAIVLLCIPTLKRETLEDLSFDDFKAITDFVMARISNDRTEKEGLASPFSGKPSPSGDSSGSGCATSPTSPLQNSGS